MTYRIGDASFTRDGRPSVVTNRNRDTGIVTVEKEARTLKRQDVLVTSMVSIKTRENFNEVVKEVREGYSERAFKFTSRKD